ncbi:hypothetical protein M9978_07960 [Sphingomonas sp. MG17]|uniref:Uncharacterized protein n=1 Tax=Sphingomonas tagetis TaxID=2949092 RepID=A0A9X2KL76_9SPHN|nr:hypothetical protein [Sphingomonas tagetis]MCP3730362.1 hypothetical protein [Sphingomonas tagetis]
MTYPSFVDHMRQSHGPNWTVGRRAPPGAVALSQTAFDEAMRGWAIDHPAYRLVLTLPDCEERAFICDAVLRQLGVRSGSHPK